MTVPASTSRPAWVVEPERPADTPAVERLVEEVFGDVMRTRASWHLRQGVAHDPALAFVIREAGGEIIGTVSITPVLVGGDRVMMLGPLAVRPDRKSKGMGTALMNRVMSAIRALPAVRTGGLVFLVGDRDYYVRFGFERVPHRQITFAHPVDYDRVLAVELVPGRLNEVGGLATKVRDDVLDHPQPGVLTE